MQRTVGLLFFLSGAVAVLGITLAEILYPQAYNYSVSLNMISDLAYARVPPRIVPEPSAAIFNISLIASGSLVLAGVFLGKKVFSGKFTMFGLILLGAGSIGVGVFPEYHLALHPLVALCTFLGGAIAAISYSRSRSYPLSILSLTLGSISLVFLILGVLLPHFIVPVLGRGGTERMAAYPILIWLVVLGGFLMGSSSFAKTKKA